ncbi:MAG: sigma-70 family RNA polymerase sigma factor [Pirellulales bacterium]|nr:sigma-70 family RNA polymerase sigma factor [Pirellulales bacterium]
MSDQNTEPQFRNAALHKLFVRHTSALRGYLLALMPDADGVDDVLHNTFLVISRKADQFDESRDFLSWARGIARHELYQYLRDCSRAPRSLSPDVIEELSIAMPLVEDVDEERIAATSECIDDLAPRARQSMRLRYSEGMSLKEIARNMELAVGTVKSTLAKARSQVRECVHRKLDLSRRTQDGS